MTGNILAPLECRYDSTGLSKQDSMTENSYCASRFERGLVVQLQLQSRGPVTFSLCSNVDTIIPVSDREQLPSLSQSERLGGPVCECDGDILLCLYVNTGTRGSCLVAVAAPAGADREALCTLRQ